MRADAQRNYDRIVAVASDLFATRGTDVSLDEVAKRAGVGPGTLYRHFPSREALLSVAMERWVDRIRTAAAEVAVSEQSPRAMLLTWLDTLLVHISQYRGGPARLVPAMGNPDAPLYDRYRVVAEATTTVLDRLAVDEALRPGVDTLTVCRLVGGVAIVADLGGLDVATVRALLAIVADGLLC